MFELKAVSSLEKIMPRGDAQEISSLTALSGEPADVQFIFKTDIRGSYRLSLSCEGAAVRVYAVKYVPVGLTAFRDARDDDYISHEPGLYPDLLEPVENGWFCCTDFPQVVYASIDAPAGEHIITCSFCDAWGNKVAEKQVALSVLSVKLPPQKLKFTQWFHADCISEHYGCEAFSERHWQLLESFLQTAFENGINMILTPVFTPPLDTAVGGERPTVQLVKIKKSGGEYLFDFSLLRRWTELCRKIGIEYFEIPPLFTQWGAQFTPKIIAEENGGQKRIFGWDVSAVSEEYKGFLSQFLPALRRELAEEGVEDKTYFHISDEPSELHIESYAAARAAALPYLSGCKIIDALSNVEYLKAGLIETPVVSTNHIEPFLNEKVSERWCYYCCGNGSGVSNRFIAMRSARTRSLGVQLFKFGMDGFLQWGYNFYYSMESRRRLNPFIETDAGGAFPSGDAFSVYPGDKGAFPSLRLFVFRQGLCDLRALELLESHIGRENAVRLAEEALGEEISFRRCHSAAAIEKMRAAVNKKLCELSKTRKD